MGNLEQALLDNLQDDMCSLVLSVAETEVLLNLVEYMKESDVLPMEHAHVADILLDKLAQSLEISCPTYYVNVYEHQQYFGGYEEGGWHYWTKECVYTDAFVDIDEALDAIPELVDDWFHSHDPAEYFERLSALRALWEYSALSLADRFVGIYENNPDHKYNYYSVEVEFQPAATEDMETKHYE